MKRILVMNDDQELLELFRLLLTEEGYEKGVTVVLKPFDLDELLHAIRKAFSFVNLPAPEKYMEE